MSATSITVHVPLALRKRGGRKVVVGPDGSALPGLRPTTTSADPALLKAFARAFRWRRMLEDGHYGSISDIARAEKIDRTYLGDLLRLTLLAPDLVEMFVNGRQPDGVRLPALLQPFPADWKQQRIWLGGVK